ncbi:MAG: methylmalonyl Co-A mutase-associated GTPase MeaB [Myxococcota bacterium]
MRARLTVDDHVRGVLAGDRAVIGRTLTLVESSRPDHRERANEVVRRLLPHTGTGLRIGVSGVPGVGKSTFLEALGSRLIDAGHRVAVLAIDPTSGVSGGSILGDKTRMGRLSTDAAAFVRPSPSGGALGGVARTTRESILVCEAAGFDLVFVETVGVGQSETVVAQMVDTYLVLMLAGAGDDLQGIKRGILELADVLAVQKADGDNVLRASQARRQLQGALSLLRGHEPVPVLTCSALTEEGLDEVWQAVKGHGDALRESGGLEARRSHQRQQWMWQIVEHEAVRRLRTHPRVQAVGPELQDRVFRGEITAGEAAEMLLRASESDGPTER